jgi:hypothetical protein
VPDILHAPGRKIVHDQDFVAAIEKPLSQVGTDEPRASGD